MPTKRDRNPLPIQYLGERGTTEPCVRAMVTILTSPYRCRAMTVLFCHKRPEEDSYAVCFVVWDWLDREITVVPDGFGTHQGIGGWGLALVLSLIRFYQVPLQEKWIQADQFERIANGHLTVRDRQQLHQADDGAPSWPFHEGDFGPELWSQVARETSQFPYWLIEPELLNDTKDLERNPGSAVFQSARRLEMVVRSLDPSLAGLIGQDLINQAMREGRLWEPHGEAASERQAWANLFRGVVGAIRNPEGHRDQQLSLEDAIGQVLTVNMLLRKLKVDFPDHFRQAASSREADEDEQEREEGEQAASPAYTERS